MVELRRGLEMQLVFVLGGPGGSLALPLTLLGCCAEFLGIQHLSAVLCQQG